MRRSIGRIWLVLAVLGVMGTLVISRASGDGVLTDCAVDAYGAFPSGDSWTFHVESSDTDPTTADARGNGRHVASDGRTFLLMPDFMRCRVNGGRVVDITGRTVIVDNGSGSGVGRGNCSPAPAGANGARPTCEFRINARDDGDFDDYTFRLIDPQSGGTAYAAGGFVTDNGEIAVTPK